MGTGRSGSLPRPKRVYAEPSRLLRRPPISTHRCPCRHRQFQPGGTPTRLDGTVSDHVALTKETGFPYSYYSDLQKCRVTPTDNRLLPVPVSFTFPSLSRREGRALFTTQLRFSLQFNTFPCLSLGEKTFVRSEDS